MPSSRGSRRRLVCWAAGAATLAAAVSGTLPARAADSAAPPTGTATAIAGKASLNVTLLSGLLSGLHLGGPDGIDIPLADLALGEADAPNANGDSANFTNSVVRLRDDLITKLKLPGPEADLIKADAVSGTARVINGPGGYSQAYATVTNLRLFLPLVTLPGASADNGILKVDAVSAQATCLPGQKPSASAKLPTTILLLGQQIPVPLSGNIDLPIGPLGALGDIQVHLSPATTTTASGASAAVAAGITLNAVNVAKVDGSIVLASAACTMPGAAAAGSGTPTSAGGGTSAGNTGGATGGTTTSVGGGAPTSGANGSATSIGAAAATSAGAKAGAPAGNGNGDTDLAATGASGSLLPIAGTAAVLVLGGIGLLVFLKRRSATLPPSPPEE